MLSHEALCDARLIYLRITRAHQLAVDGDKDGALTMLGVIERLVVERLPVLDGVIRAQAEAAEAFKLSQRNPPRLIAGAFANVPNPHSDAANPHPPSPEQPGSGVA